MDILAEHLTKTKKLLDKQENCPLDKLLISLQNSLQELRKTTIESQIEFRREIIELVKLQQINVGPNQTRLQSLPYLTGKYKEIESASLSSNNKKRKKK